MTKHAQNPKKTPLAFEAMQKALGMSDIRLAEAIGVTRMAVYNWRKGLRPVPLWAWKSMDRLIGVSSGKPFVQ